MINGNFQKWRNNQAHNQMEENEKKMKEYITRLLENINLTSLSTFVDLEENEVKIRFSAIYRDSPSPFIMKEALDDIIQVETRSHIDQILTSGITPLERELMDEQLTLFQNKQKEQTSCEIHYEKNAKNLGISGV